MIYYKAVRYHKADEYAIFIMCDKRDKCVGQLILDDCIVSKDCEISLDRIFEQMYQIVCEEYEYEHVKD